MTGYSLRDEGSRYRAFVYQNRVAKIFKDLIMSSKHPSYYLCMPIAEKTKHQIMGHNGPKF